MLRLNKVIDQQDSNQFILPEEIELLPRQIELLQWVPKKKSKVILCWGGTRSGKTVGVCIYIALCMYAMPRFTIALFATTEGQAELTLGDTLRNVLKTLGIAFIEENKYNHKNIVLQNGSRAIIAGYQGRGIDNLIMGAPLDAAAVDEARYLKEEQFSKLRSRLSGCCQYMNVQFVMLLTNPEGQEAWLYTKFIEKNKDNILFPPKDNLKNLPDDYIDSMREDLPEFMVKRLIDSIWCSAEGACFPDIASDDVFIKQADAGYPIFQSSGVDFGYNHYFSYTLWEINANQELIVKDTFFTNKTVLDIYAENVLDIIFRNPAARNQPVNVYTEHEPEKVKMLSIIINKVKPCAVFKNANKLVKGDVCIFFRRLMVRKKFKMIDTPGNRRLFQQIRSAVWDSSGRDMPLKKEGIEDDGLDALIYSGSKLYNNQQINAWLGMSVLQLGMTLNANGEEETENVK